MDWPAVRPLAGRPSRVSRARQAAGLVGSVFCLTSRWQRPVDMLGVIVCTPPECHGRRVWSCCPEWRPHLSVGPCCLTGGACSMAVRWSPNAPLPQAAGAVPGRSPHSVPWVLLVLGGLPWASGVWNVSPAAPSCNHAHCFLRSRHCGMCRRVLSSRRACMLTHNSAILALEHGADLGESWE